jgi:hypothetical protein
MITTSDSRSSRGIEGMLVGALLAGGILAPLAFFFKSYLGVYDLVAGVIAGAIVGFILKACIPKGFPIPKNITTFTCLGMSAFCFWVIIDGIITGEIHDLPRRRAGVGKGFARMWSWKSDPIDFTFLLFMWTLGGALCVGIPLWYYLKAIREASRDDSLPNPTKLQITFAEWEKLSKNTQGIVVFIIAVSSMLVVFYLLVLLKS